METDDADPYVCFRRREVRQVRKTRGRDAQSAEKLKRLRRELEEARQILALVKQRETAKREQLAVDKQLFEQRNSLRQLKQNLPAPYKEGDEDLLVTQKVRMHLNLKMNQRKRKSWVLTLRSRKRKSHQKQHPSAPLERSSGYLRDKIIDPQRRIYFSYRMS